MCFDPELEPKMGIYIFIHFFFQFWGLSFFMKLEKIYLCTSEES
jgi:hypothetical protein